MIVAAKVFLFNRFAASFYFLHNKKVELLWHSRVYYSTAQFKKVDKVKYKIDQKRNFSSQMNTFGRLSKRN